jgi:hypothetical protein
MKIKQLKEKTIKGFIDFLPKVVVDNIEGFSNILNDKLSKSEGGEVNKPIVVTNKDSDYSITINPDGSIYIWSKTEKENLFSLKIDNKDINHFVIINDDIYRGLCINKIHALCGQNGDLCYDGVFGNFYASKYIIEGSNNTRVLLGDGSTTGKLVKDIRVNRDGVDKKNTLLLMLQYIDGTALGTEFPAATKKLAGLMTADDKAKLDNIENTYISSQNGNIYSEYDTNNGNTILDVTGNYDEEGSAGRIRLKYTEDNKGKLSIMLDGSESSVNAEKFSSIIFPNKNEVWSTDGGRINILNLLSNAAIYVAGGKEGTQPQSINHTTVIDNPDNIIFDLRMKMFLARKGLVYYSHWNADISKNIAPPSRYGIENDNGVFPFNNQMYKFSNYDDIYIATCSNGICIMEKLTLK